MVIPLIWMLKNLGEVVIFFEDFIGLSALHDGQAFEKKVNCIKVEEVDIIIRINMICKMKLGR